MYTIFIYAYNRVFLIMAVTGEIAGQPVTLNNAAEEATLQAINNNLRQLGQAAGYNLTGLRQADAAGRRATGALNSVARAAGLSASNLDANSSALSKYTQSVGQTLGRVSINVGRALDTSSESLSSTILSLGSAFGDIAKLVPGLGFVFGTAGGVIAGQVAGMVKSFETAQRSGGSFGYSMAQFGDTALRAGLTFGQMAEVTNKAGQALSQFGGTTTQGSQDFIRFNSALRRSSFSTDLMRMGMSITDQAVAMADYTGQLARFGQNIGELDTRSTVADMALYQRELKALAQITGTTLDQQRALQKKEMQDANSRAAIMTLSKDQQLVALNAITAATEKFGPQAGKVIQELLAHGDVVSKESLMFAEQNGAAFGYMRNLTSDLRAGAASADGVTQMFKDMEGDSRIGADLQRNAQLAATMIGVAHSNAYIDTIKASLPQIADTVGQFRNAGVEKILEDQKKLSESTDGLTTAMNAAAVAIQDSKIAIGQAVLSIGNTTAAQNIAQDLTNFSNVVSQSAQAFSDTLNQTRGDYKDAINAMVQAATGKEESKITSRLNDTAAIGDFMYGLIPERETGTLGGAGRLFENFGKEQLVKLHGVESVTTPDQMAGIVEQSARGGMNAFANVFNRLRIGQDSQPNVAAIFETMRSKIAEPEITDKIKQGMDQLRAQVTKFTPTGREIRQPSFNLETLKTGLEDIRKSDFTEMSKQILETVNNNTLQSKQPAAQQAPMASVAAPKNLDQEMLSALQHSNDVLMRIYRELEDGHRRLERAYT